jgi:hypothetical protein
VSDLLGFALALPLVALLGWSVTAPLVAPSDGRAFRLALQLTAGLVGLHLWLLGLDLVGLAWSRGSIVGGVVLASALLRWRLGAPGPSAAQRGRLGWGEAVAVAALVAFALAAVAVWSLNPDFIYHWGIKGKRYLLAAGIDFEFLAAPANVVRHPDYPNLLPGLYAATALLAGRWAEPSMLAWTAVAFGLVLAAAREALRDRGSFARQATLAYLGLSGGAFGIGFLTPGGPDWWIALAPLLALPAFLEAGRGEPRAGLRARDAQVALAAALAAGAKVEGLPLAAFLLGVYWLVRGPRERWRSLPRLLLPVGAVAGLWLWGCFAHGLFVEQRGGWPTLRFLPEILVSVGESLRFPEWHRASAVFGLAPALLLMRRTRALGVVLTLQAAFYLYVYLSFPVTTAEEARYLVRSNAARLLLHLFPAVVVGAGLLLDRLLARLEEPPVEADQNAEVSARPQMLP